MALDIKLLYLLNNFAGQSRIFDIIIVFLASYLQYFLVAAFLLLLFFWRYSKQKKFRIFWVAAISVIIARLGITEIIRFFYHRPRPFVVYPVHQLLSENEWSFPSGHSAFFFALAAAVYLYNKKWGAGFFLAAVLMNVSRVMAGVHYPSDILGGMIVGIFTACITLYFLNSKNLWTKN